MIESSHAVAIALLALGLVLIGLRQRRRQWPRRPGH
jgi:MYXO-CTERM domain-containing protein